MFLQYDLQLSRIGGTAVHSSIAYSCSPTNSSTVTPESPAQPCSYSFTPNKPHPSYKTEFCCPDLLRKLEAPLLLGLSIAASTAPGSRTGSGEPGAATAAASATPAAPSPAAPTPSGPAAHAAVGLPPTRPRPTSLLPLPGPPLLTLLLLASFQAILVAYQVFTAPRASCAGTAVRQPAWCILPRVCTHSQHRHSPACLRAAVIQFYSTSKTSRTKSHLQHPVPHVFRMHLCNMAAPRAAKTV